MTNGQNTVILFTFGKQSKQMILYLCIRLNRLYPFRKMEYRLNKFISNSGYCSRREADRLIEAGNVTINGKRANLGDRVLPRQIVKVDGYQIIHDIEPVYIALNKPQGITSTTDTKDPDNIIDFVAHEYRIFPIGRLDKDSQGLILLTNDGDIVNKVLRSENNHEKEYLVTLDRAYDQAFLEGMANGVPITEGVTTRKCKVEKISSNVFKITLTQGINRQIRRMCEYFNYLVVKLERVRVLNIKLGKLGLGNWRDLTHAELNDLFDILDKSDGASAKKQKAAKLPQHSTGYGKKARREAEKNQTRVSNKRIGKQRPEKAMRNMKGKK